jgi:hypothetical protein
MISWGNQKVWVCVCGGGEYWICIKSYTHDTSHSKKQGLSWPNAVTQSPKKKVPDEYA